MAKSDQDRESKAKDQLASFLVDCAIEQPQGSTVLEIGFKSGHFLDQCHNAGMDCVGLEVERKYFDHVKRRLPHIRAICYDGEVFPLDDASVDYVVSFQVLEHVESVEAIITECMRVLKPGGMMYHICPNYKSFYEGHFNVFWWPFLNKSTGRTYLKLLGKYNPSYEALSIVKPKTVKRIVRGLPDNAEIISLGKREFDRKFSSKQAAKVKNKGLQSILNVMLRFPLLSKIPLKLIARAGWYYPMTIIIKRK